MKLLHLKLHLLLSSATACFSSAVETAIPILEVKIPPAEISRDTGFYVLSKVLKFYSADIPQLSLGEVSLRQQPAQSFVPDSSPKRFTPLLTVWLVPSTCITILE